MTRSLLPHQRSVILRYAGKHEQENLFVLGTFNREQDPFARNAFAGVYRGEQLIGLGAYFGRFGSLVLHAENNRGINDLVDHFVKARCRIEWMPMFERHALPAIARLRRYGMVPTMMREETVFLLTKHRFKGIPHGMVRTGTPGDIDDIIGLEQRVNGEQRDITERDRQQIFPKTEYLLRVNGVLVARANVQGWSDQYAQIGGVMTHPEHRGKGYAKQVVSAACKHWLSKGKRVQLFCKNDNAPAHAVYEAIGFRPIDRFILAQF